MKCPECAANHKYSAGMKCRCGYKFALDPKSRGITDGKMMLLIQRASAQSTYFYTANQLYAQYCRLKYSSPLIPAIVGALIAVGSTPLFLDNLVWAGLFMILLGGAFLILVIQNWRSVPSRSAFDSILESWRIHKAETLDKLLSETTMHEPPPEWQEPDIYDYGVERMLIVERDLLVDLFVKNGFHAEERTLVLSQSGYPSYVARHAKRLLDENPDLPVFLLHDATPDGEHMLASLTLRGDMPITGHPIVDLGLFCEGVAKLRRLRYLKLNIVGYEIPVDMLMYKFLAAGLGTALAEGITLADAAEQYQQSGGSGGDSGSFG